MDRQNQKQAISTAFSQTLIPDDEEDYEQYLSAFHIHTNRELGIHTNRDLGILRSVVQDEIYRRRRAGRDASRAERFLKWLWKR